MGQTLVYNAENCTIQQNDIRFSRYKKARTIVSGVTYNI